MSGEFLKKMDCWYEIQPAGQTMVFAGMLSRHWPEIRAVVEAAHGDLHTVRGRNMLSMARHALDEKVRKQ